MFMDTSALYTCYSFIFYNSQKNKTVWKITWNICYMNSVDLTQHIFIQLYSIHCVVLHCLYIPHYKYLLVFCYQSRCIPFLSCCEWSSNKHECAIICVIIYVATWVHNWEGWCRYTEPLFSFCFVLFFTIFGHYTSLH